MKFNDIQYNETQSNAMNNNVMQYKNDQQNKEIWVFEALIFFFITNNRYPADN